MNYYAFHIGDYAAATRHLTDFEDLAYRRLMDLYYSTEAPIPLDRRQVYRLVRASSEDMRQAVDVVLTEFFHEQEDGWHHKRCDAEIAKKLAKVAKAKANGKLGGEANAKRSLPETEANATDLGSEREAPNPNPNPNPNPKKVMLGSVARARDPDADLEYKLREAAGWQSHPAPKLAITGPIVALLDAGADLDLDVLPVIKSCAANCRSPNWKFFLGAITQARDDRINAATIVNPPSQANGVYRNGSDRKSYSRDATFDAIDRRIDELAAEERMRANGSADVDGFADGEAFPSRTPHH